MLVYFDTVPTFNQFDTQCRKAWSLAKNRETSNTYRFWGDTSLLDTWKLFIARLAREGTIIPTSVITCADILECRYIVEGINPTKPRIPETTVEAVYGEPPVV